LAISLYIFCLVLKRLISKVPLAFNFIFVGRALELGFLLFSSWRSFLLIIRPFVAQSSTVAFAAISSASLAFIGLS